MHTKFKVTFEIEVEDMDLEAVAEYDGISVDALEGTVFKTLGYLEPFNQFKKELADCLKEAYNAYNEEYLFNIVNIEVIEHEDIF